MMKSQTRLQVLSVSIPLKEGDEIAKELQDGN